MATEQPKAKPPKPAPRSPWMPPPWTKADAYALQALARGEASPDMQRRALEWIIQQAAATYDEPYRPGGVEGERDTTLSLGRAFVGRQIVKLLNLNLAKIPNDDPRANPVEPRT